MSQKSEKILKDEIWGCYKYIGISMETLMKMPVRDRRYYIQKHIAEQASKNAPTDTRNTYTYTDGASINKFAANEQSNEKARVR